MPDTRDGPRIVNALSFDIEDWFHMIGIDGVDDPETWSELPSILEYRTHEILDELDRRGVRATFFIVGWVADRYPHVVREIAIRGHEIGTHSYWHRTVSSLTPEAFAEDIAQSIDSIGTASGVCVRGFRAPSFSIVPGCEWAFDVLLDAGLSYDASLFPAPRGHGGYPCPIVPHKVTAPSGRTLPVLPMSVTRLLGKSIGFSGGGYLRLLPAGMIRRTITKMNGQGLPAVVYLHPADFAVDRPHVSMPLGRRFKTRVGLHTTMPKLRHLLDRFQFDSCAAVLGLDSIGKGVPAYTTETP